MELGHQSDAARPPQAALRYIGLLKFILNSLENSMITCKQYVEELMGYVTVDQEVLTLHTDMDAGIVER